MKNQVTASRERTEGTIPSDCVGTGYVAVEVKRKAGIDAVEQLTRYLHFLNRDPATRPCRGIIAATSITPQAVTLAESRGIKTVVVDYDELRGIPSNKLTLF